MDTPPIFGLIPATEDPEDLPEPTNGPYFVATKSGYLMMDSNHFGRYLVPVKEIASLPDTKEVMWYSIPKMPDWVIGQAWSFFRAIYNEMKSEAMLDITWSREKGYRLFVPPQRASGGGVQASRTPEHYKGQMVGTIHSHCNFNAFHSGTDTHDADGHDGLHITIGNVLNTLTPSIAIMVSKNTKRWHFKIEDVQEGDEIVMYDHPTWWEKYVSEPEKKGHVSQVNYGHAFAPKGGSKYDPTAHSTHDCRVHGGKNWPIETTNPKTGLVVVGGKTNPKEEVVKPGTKQFDLIEQLIKAGDNIDTETAGILMEIGHEMFIIESVLNQAGIHIDYQYTVPEAGVLSKADREEFADDLPASWRYLD